MGNETELSRSSSIKRKKSSKRKRRWPALILLFTIILIGFTAIGSYAIWQFTGSFFSPDVDGFEIGGSKSSSIFPNLTGRVNAATEKDSNVIPVAIIGTDNRTGSGGTLNADVLMVAFIAKKEKAVYLLSIPRDTKMVVPGYQGPRKANSAFALGEAKRRSQEVNNQTVTETGTFLVRGMLSEYLEVPINHHIHIDFNGFVEMVNAVGGVEINVQRSMEYDDPMDGTHIRLQPGLQTLKGEQALNYVRHRLDNRGPSYYSSDFERNARQQEVLRAIAKKSASLSGILNVRNIVDALTRNVQTNIPPDDMFNVAISMIGIDSEDIHTIDNEAYWDSAQSYTIIPNTRLEEIKEEIKDIYRRNK